MAADQAIILAGGFGTRLREVVADLPKPLAPVAGRPFLAWLLDSLARGGMRHAVLATGYMADAIEAFGGHDWNGMTLDYSREQQPLGTGGAVRLAASGIDTTQGVHVVNGDTYLDYAPQALENAASGAGMDAAIALAHVDDVSRYGAVAVEAGKVSAFSEKGGSGPGWINAGCYFLSQAALARLPGLDSFSLERELIEPLAAGGRLAAFTRTDGFIDIGVPEDYRRAQSLFGPRP